MEGHLRPAEDHSAIGAASSRMESHIIIIVYGAGRISGGVRRLSSICSKDSRLSPPTLYNVMQLLGEGGGGFQTDAGFYITVLGY